MKIVFTGPEDVRILASDDLKRHSAVEGFTKTTFAKGRPVEVDDEVALALTTQTEVYGNFEEFVLGEPVSTTKSAEAVKAEKEADPEIAAAKGGKSAGEGSKTASTTTSGSTARS
jgi:hypothetical protein